MNIKQPVPLALPYSFSFALIVQIQFFFTKGYYYVCILCRVYIYIYVLRDKKNSKYRARPHSQSVSLLSRKDSTSLKYTKNSSEEKGEEQGGVRDISI